MNNYEVKNKLKLKLYKKHNFNKSQSAHECAEV